MSLKFCMGGIVDFVVIKAKIFRDNSEIAVQLPVILTDHGVLIPFLDYLMEKSHVRSYSWIQKCAQAVSLLLRYMSANQGCFDEPRALFTSFVQRLYSGTIGENGDDPSGLYWFAKRIANTSQLIMHLNEFFDWVEEKYNVTSVNPIVKSTRHNELIFWAAYHNKRNRSFLGHTWNKAHAVDSSKWSRATAIKRTPTAGHSEVKYFPLNRIKDLLYQGFIIPGRQNRILIEDRINIRDVLITILLHGGGVRMSEAFHLYIDDVRADPFDNKKALVCIYHPENGLAPSDWIGLNGKPIHCNREAYLRGKYGLRPRNQYPKTDAMHAGWKDPRLDDQTGNYMLVRWFPAFWGEIFKNFWSVYLRQLLMVRRNHPFAFVSFRGDQAGSPYSIDSYKRAHSRAVKRIGLMPAKMEGTTPHGHRHAYGLMTYQGKIDAHTRMIMLHHKSIESQAVYTEPTIEMVTEQLKEAEARLAGIGQTK